MSDQSPGLVGITRAWLELARLSNAPTVVTNTLVGFTLASAATPKLATGANGWPALDWPRFALAGSVALLLYTAGMILNDAKDARRDKETRPERPIPSGRVCRTRAWALGSLLLVVGVGLAALLGLPALLVALGIALGAVLYTWLHADHAWAVALMGVCRFGLYPLGALAGGDGSWASVSPAILIFGGALALATPLLTLVARAESSAHPDRQSPWTRPLAWAVVFVPLASPLLVEPPVMRSTPSLLFAVGFALWGAYSARAAIAGRLHVAIPGWIAGFCLFDALILAMHGQLNLALACAGAFVLTRLAQRVLPGT